MKHIERVMRVMTHVNIGATLGMAAWIAWSGLQLVGGNLKPPRPAATPPRASGAQPAGLACCFTPVDTLQAASTVVAANAGGRP